MKLHAIICIKTPIQIPFHTVQTKTLELSLKGRINISDDQWLIQVEGKRSAIHELIKIMLHATEFSDIKIEINQTLQHFNELTMNIV